MKKLLIVMVSAVLCVFSTAYAAAPAEGVALKIGVIDLQQIIQQTPDAKVANTQLRKQFDPKQQKIVALQKSLKSNMEKLKRDDAIMGESEKTKLQGSIVNQRRDLTRMQQDFQQDVNLAQRRATDKFFAKVKKVVDKIATKEHYDLVLQKSRIPYASKRVELTQQVIKALS